MRNAEMIVLDDDLIISGELAPVCLHKGWFRSATFLPNSRTQTLIFNYISQVKYSKMSEFYGKLHRKRRFSVFYEEKLAFSATLSKKHHFD